MALFLGIESTCDETAAAVVRDGWEVQSNAIATQFELHRKFKGVVPEIASRAHIENILPVIQDALSSAGCALTEIDAIAVANRPGLIGSLLIGVTAAKTLAWAMGKPLISVDHVQAHLYSVMLEDAIRITGEDHQRPGETSDGKSANTARAREFDETRIASSSHGISEPQARPDPPVFPAVGLVVSGGHTALYRIENFSNIVMIGSTIDDAVGEAYDKVAAILELGFPGGPTIDRLAQRGDPRAIDFPRSYLDRDSLDFSFSGLKTAVLYQVRGKKGRERDASSLSEQAICDVAASFQAACVEVILRKLRRAIEQIGGQCVIVGGGVSANQGLRAALKNLPVPVLLPALKFCTDNAAMSAGLGFLKYQQRQFSSLDLDAVTQSELRRVEPHLDAENSFGHKRI